MSTRLAGRTEEAASSSARPSIHPSRSVLAAALQGDGLPPENLLPSLSCSLVQSWYYGLFHLYAGEILVTFLLRTHPEQEIAGIALPSFGMPSSAPELWLLPRGCRNALGAYVGSALCPVRIRYPEPGLNAILLMQHPSSAVEMLETN